MADNRGNSSGSNSNLTMPNGVTRPTSNNHKNDFDKLNYETLKQMSIANAEVMKILQDITKSKSIKGFEETINKLSNDIVKTHKTVNEQINKLNKEELEFKKKFTKEIQEREKQKGNIINVAQAFKLATESEEFKTMKLHYKNEMEKLEKTTKDEAKNSRKELIKRTFKLDTENKTVKFLDSKFAKNNNLKSTSNEYFSELEKLKSSSLETYGEGFDVDKKNKGYKEYKQALMNLNDKYSKDLKDAWKEDFKENHKVLSGISSGIKETFDKNKESLQGLLGPLNLFLSPMKDFFGGFGLVFKGIKGGAKWLFGKFTKKNPTVSDVLKSGAFGVGSLYIGHKLEELFGSEDRNLDESLFGNVFDDFTNGAKAFSSVVSSPIFQSLATVGGIALVVKDAMAGWKKADEWGTSNWASMLGAIVGSTSSGGNGAIQGVIKYALLGASFGPFGILIGGILGGVLGFFGGKFWAQGLDDFKKLITGEETQDSIRKRKLLEDIEKQKTKGEISELDYNTMIKLSNSMSDADFASLGLNQANKNKGGVRRGIIEQLAKGNLNSLNDKELISLLKNKTGLEINNTNLETYKNLFSWMSSNINAHTLDNILKDESSFGSFLNYIQMLQRKQNRSTEKYDAFAQANGFLGGRDSEIYKSLMSTGFFDLGIENINTEFKQNKNKFAFTDTSLIDLDNKVKALTDVDDAIIKTDGSVIKTNPKDTLVALKDVPLSMDKVREDANKSINSSINGLEKNVLLENKLSTIIDVLSRILEKDIQIQLPPQTRNDLDMLMSGGMI